MSVFLKPEFLISQNNELPCSGLFCSENIIDLQLELYFDSLLAGGTSEELRYQAILKTIVNKKTDKTFNIKLSKRGHFRKFPNICDFPPLRIHFKEKEVVGTEFEGLKKIKIVTHCQNNDSAFDQYVVQEYLIYKAYNLLTEHSFRVRLARIRYVDLSKTFPDVIFFYLFYRKPRKSGKKIKRIVP
ncbi:MAG: hypothetical protein HC905_26785 [Bacteroidales bacterium]|nr:hypothetical protein [Bacteroidales bacterium]